MSEKLLKLFLMDNPIATKTGATVRVSMLFNEIESLHGKKAAQQIFDKWGTPKSKRELNERKGWRLLERLDWMPEPNIAEFARQIEAENAALPDDDQLTPRRRPTLATIDHYLRELIRQRRVAIEAGTWDGPVPPFPDKAV